jgi:hypothetical protein
MTAFHTRPDHCRGRRTGRAHRPHLDEDFDVIAEITGQPVERLSMQAASPRKQPRGLGALPFTAPAAAVSLDE